MSEAELATLDTCNTRPSTLSSLDEEDSDRSTLVSRVIVSPDPSDSSAFSSDCSPPPSPASMSTVSPSSPPPAPDALLLACQNGDAAEARYLVEQGYAVDNGALHCAAAGNSYELCELLLAHGADPNARAPPFDATPILCAARNGHAYIVRLLLEHKADVLAIDGFGCTLLHLAVQSSNILMVIYAASLGVPVDALDTGRRTALHWAAAQGDHLSVQALLKAGASPDALDGDGSCALVLASGLGQSSDSVALLLRANADPAPAVACSDLGRAWTDGCKAAGRTSLGHPVRSRIFSPETAKLTASVTPIVVIATSFWLPGAVGAWLGLFLAGALIYTAKRWLDTCVLPIAWPEARPLVHSTVLAGGFCAVLVLDVAFWATRLVPALYASQRARVWELGVAIIGTAYFYVMAVLLDPGIVPLKAVAGERADMDELMARGLFDSTHFCVHTHTKIPARASYDHYLERLVCRYDHYCPWIYNAVGLRNHRHFVLFLLFLIAATILYFAAYAAVPQLAFTWYGTLLLVVTAVQSLWIYVLAVVQLFQLAHGATTYEFSHAHLRSVHVTDPVSAFSSLPRDHPRAQLVLRPTAAQSLRRHVHAAPPRSRFTLLWKLTGVHQVRVLYRLHRSHRDWNTHDRGVLRNILRFFAVGGNLLHPSECVSERTAPPADY